MNSDVEKVVVALVITVAKTIVHLNVEVIAGMFVEALVHQVCTGNCKMSALFLSVYKIK